MVRKIQGFMGVPPMRKNVAADEHGLGLLSEDRLKQLLVSACPAVKVGDKEVQGHGENDSEKPRRGQLRRIRL
jgi:hypothetical protein